MNTNSNLSINAFQVLGDISCRLSNNYSFRLTSNYLNNNRYSTEREKRWIWGVSAKADLFHSTHLSFQYQNTYIVEDLYRDRSLLQFSLNQRIKQQHQISLNGFYTLLRNTNQQKQFTAEMSYTLQLGIPISKRKVRGNLYGTIQNLGVEKIEGIVLTMNGKTAITDEKGDFAFKGLEAGEYYLILDRSSVGINDVADTSLPIKVKIEKGTDNSVRFSMVQGASISGFIQLSKDARHINIGGNKPTFSMDNWLIEIKNEESIYRQLSSDNGHFSFSHLQAGQWQVKIYMPEQLSKYLSLEQDTFNISLEKGESYHIDLNASHKKRKIKYVSKTLFITEAENK